MGRALKYQLSGQKLETEVSGADPGRCHMLPATPKISFFLSIPQPSPCGEAKE